jgi:2-iminobutanoate/2-iminopropanoate deaminase
VSIEARRVLNGLELPRPLGHYSPAVKAGPMVFVSAQAGIDPSTGQIPGGGVEAECRQVFDNLALVLEAAKASLSDIVKTTLLYANPDDLLAINRVYEELFPVDPPARTAAVVKLSGGRRISIDAIAVPSEPNT